MDSLCRFIGQLKPSQRNLLQLDSYSKGTYGFYTSPTGNGFSRHASTRSIVNFAKKNQAEHQMEK